MIRSIVKDPLFLGQKARKAGKDDIVIGRDLLDTLLAHQATCVGMAANMIGEAVAVIAVDTGQMKMVMFNPVIVKRSGPYETSEGCLSLPGIRKVQRYQTITVKFQDMCLQEETAVFSGKAAEIIQHECDHLAGILI